MKLAYRKDHKIEKSDEHYTPKWVFDFLEVTFDLDVASPVEKIDHVPALKRYTEDSLEKPWEGLIWMNPPYSNATPWINKFIDHGNGIALLHCSKSKWFNRIWSEADAVVAMPPTFKFERPDGTFRSIAFQTFLFAKGLEAVEALNKADWARVR